MNAHPLFCFTHRQFGCVHDKMQDDCEFVTAVGLCDRIDTLTAENAGLLASIEECQATTFKRERDDALADLRSLKAAVAGVKKVTGQHVIGDVEWRVAFRNLLALVPSDGSWETEQTAAGDDPFDLNVCIREPFASVYLEAPPASREEGKQQ